MHRNEEILAMPRRAYSYRRISDPKQRQGDGLNRQADFAERLCAKHGWTLDDSLTFIDRGRSGRHGDHRRCKGQLLTFLDTVRRRRIMPGSVLIIENLDRLTREEMDEAHDLFKSILKSGFWIATEMPERIYTPESLKTLLGTIEPLLHMYVAHEQSKKLSARILDKWEHRRERARKERLPFGRGCPLWMELTNSGYSLIATRAATVRKIFDLAINGMGAHRIITWLKQHAKEHPAFGRSGRWSCAYVLQILRGRMVLGEYQPKRGRHATVRKAEGEAIANYYPPVVTEEIWRMAQMSLDSRRHKCGRPGQHEANLFTGIVFEVSSRLPMCIVTHSCRYRGKTTFYRYLMPGDARKGCKTGKGIPYRRFEDGVLDVLEMLQPQDVLPPGPAQDEREHRIIDLTDRQRSLEVRIQEIKNAIEDPDNEEDVSSLTASRRSLLAKLREVEKELEKLKWESRTGQGETLAETQTLIRHMRKMQAEGKLEEWVDIRRRIKGAIPWLVESIWVVSQPVRERAYVAHIQIYLRNGAEPLYNQSLPTDRSGKPLTGLKLWSLRHRDFRSGNIDDIAPEVKAVS